MIDPQTFFEIAELALSIAKDIEGEKIGMDTETSMFELTKRSINAVEQHTGEPFDLSLIRIEQPL